MCHHRTCTNRLLERLIVVVLTTHYVSRAEQNMKKRTNDGDVPGKLMNLQSRVSRLWHQPYNFLTMLRRTSRSGEVNYVVWRSQLRLDLKTTLGAGHWSCKKEWRSQLCRDLTTTLGQLVGVATSLGQLVGAKSLEPEEGGEG